MVAKGEGDMELQYKQAYTYLFNQLTDIIAQMQSIQRQAEEICINPKTKESDGKLIKIDFE